MNNLIRLVRALCLDPVNAQHAFSHRLRVGLAIAALILVVSLLR
jgi:hypothetical protein